MSQATEFASRHQSSPETFRAIMHCLWRNVKHNRFVHAIRISNELFEGEKKIRVTNALYTFLVIKEIR